MSIEYISMTILVPVDEIDLNLELENGWTVEDWQTPLIQYILIEMLVPADDIDFRAIFEKDEDKIGWNNIKFRERPSLKNGWKICTYDTDKMDELAKERWDEI